MNICAETVKIARSIYNEWVDAMVCPKNDLCRVLSLYHQDAILLPTFSSTICTTREQLSSYFQNLIALPMLKITTEDFFASESNQVIVATGRYTFQYQSNKDITTAPARFSFVFRKVNDQWLIINHHSSMLPIQQTSL